MFGIPERLRRVRTVVSRATPLPLAVRCGVFLAGMLAAVVAFPDGLLHSRLLGVLVLMITWPAVAPRGRGTTGVALLIVAGWVLDTTYYAQPVVLWRVLALSGLLYLTHTLAALAAVLPYDGVVDVAVPIHWLGRAGGVILGSAVLTVAVLALAGEISGGVYLAATVLGLAVAVGAAALLAALLRRP